MMNPLKRLALKKPTPTEARWPAKLREIVELILEDRSRHACRFPIGSVDRITAAALRVMPTNPGRARATDILTKIIIAEELPLIAASGLVDA